MPSPAVDQPQPPGASQHAWPSDRDLATLREDVAAFAELHGVPADPRDVRVAVAPYRVCPLGAHVDHQGGRVAGMALDCGVLLGFLPAPARKTVSEEADRDEAHRTETEPEPEIGASEVLLRSDAFAGEVARFDVTRPDDELSGVPGVFVEAAATETNDTEVSLSRRSVKEKEETSGKSSGWEKFARGAAWVLADDARLRGSAPPARGVVGVARSFPPGARMDGGGLSSSAAITVACVMAIQRVNEKNERTEVASVARFANDATDATDAADAARWRVARMARRAENERVGVRCGVLDQASIALAERDALTLIDCAGETHARIRFGADRKEERSAVFAAEPTIGKTPRDRGPSGPPGGPPFKIMLAFSGLREALTSTGYNARVEECREAARLLLRASEDGASDAVLGDVSPETHAREKTRLPAHLARRAAHFFGEAKRVADGELLWRRGDLRAFGALVTESGVSSVENYECGCAPMNALRAIVCATRGVFGARFSGAGFRGCVVGLVDAAEAEAAAKSVRETYSAAFPELAGDARVELAGTGDGARIIERDDIRDT